MKKALVISYEVMKLDVRPGWRDDYLMAKIERVGLGARLTAGEVPVTKR